MVPTPTATTNAQKLTVVVLIVTSILLCEFLATAIMLTISYFMTRYVCKYDIVLILYLVVCGAFVFFCFRYNRYHHQSCVPPVAKQSMVVSRSEYRQYSRVYIEPRTPKYSPKILPVLLSTTTPVVAPHEELISESNLLQRALSWDRV